MRSRSQLSSAARRHALLAAAVLLAGAGCGRLAPDGVKSGGALAHPPVRAEVAALAASMSTEGKEVFYAARPKIVDRAGIARACTEDEVAAVLGCYNRGRIFILRVTRPELAGMMEVTAAHEMLHAVYDHLPVRERSRIDGAVEDLATSADSPRLRERLGAYGALGPLDRLNELHSILGTESAVLSPALADHYGRYLAARHHVVEASERVEARFEALERQIDALVAEADRLEAELLALEARLDADVVALEALDGRLRATRSVEGYNRLVSERNRLARSISQGIDRYNQMVDDYNVKADQIDALALEEDQLLEGLDQKAPAGP